VIAAVVLGVVALAVGCATWQQKSSDVTITMGELPDAVKPLAEKETDGCKIKEVERETKKGKVIYAITYWDQEGALMEIEYAEDGTLISKGLE
jgi:hypothetical protein